MTIHMRHIRAANLCSGGARRWFDSHDLSWNDFLSNGIAIELVEPLNDAIANRVIEIARKEQTDGR